MKEKEKNLSVEKIDKNEEKDVAGGYIYENTSNWEWCVDNNLRYEVVDDRTGKVLGRYGSEEHARRGANLKNQIGEKISTTDLIRLRNKAKKDE